MSWLVRPRLLNILKQINNNKLFPRTYFQCTKINTSICSYVVHECVYIFSKPNLEIHRYKHNKKNEKQGLSESDEDNADDFENEIQDKQTKLMTVKVNSLRADLILKAGLGIARNKIEVMFYESKIRVNGKKILKKSAMLNVGDEIDIVKGASAQNPDFLTVSRVEILSASERSEGLNVKLRRNKSLTIENYDA